MLKSITCIMCPIGCEIEALMEKDVVISLEGNDCPKGTVYVRQELISPMRNIATSIRLKGGALPLVSVRLSCPIPKQMIFQAMNVIKELEIEAPVHIGQIVIDNILGLEADVIITKNINKE